MDEGLLAPGERFVCVARASMNLVARGFLGRRALSTRSRAQGGLEFRASIVRPCLCARQSKSRLATRVARASSMGVDPRTFLSVSGQNVQARRDCTRAGCDGTLRGRPSLRWLHGHTTARCSSRGIGDKTQGGNKLSYRLAALFFLTQGEVEAVVEVVLRKSRRQVENMQNYGATCSRSCGETCV